MLPTPEKPTIIFDMDGLVSFPGFKDKVFDPLQKTGKFRLGFWSIVRDTTRVDERVLSAGITEVDFSIGGDILEEFNLNREIYHPGTVSIRHIDPITEAELNRNPESSRVRVERFLHRNIRKYGQIMGRRRITSKYIQEMETRIRRWNVLAWEAHEEADDIFRPDLSLRLRHNCIGILKYPPFLSNKPTLLVESDCSIVRPGHVNRGVREDNLTKVFAEKAGFSLILTLEHYNPKDFTDSRYYAHPWYENPPVSINDFLAHLRDLLLNWNGKRFTADLGEELGIYPYYRQLARYNPVNALV